MKPIIFIMGNPDSGKTSLARQLAPGERRIHMDNVCLVLAIKRPDLMPPEIPSDDLPDIDLTVNFTGKIHAFCAHLSRLGLSQLLVSEYMEIRSARTRDAQVVEGYALGSVLTEMETAHRKAGREVIKVWMEKSSVVIDGTHHSVEEAILVLRRLLHPVKHS